MLYINVVVVVVGKPRKKCHNFTGKNMRSGSILKIINIWAAPAYAARESASPGWPPSPLSLSLPSFLPPSLPPSLPLSLPPSLFSFTCFSSLWNTPLCPLAFRPRGSSSMAECFKSRRAAVPCGLDWLQTASQGFRGTMVVVLHSVFE